MLKTWVGSEVSSAGGELPRGPSRLQTYPIWELIPYRAWSSGAKSSGKMPADRSFWIPACFPRRKPAILILTRWAAVVGSVVDMARTLASQLRHPAHQLEACM